MYVNVKTDVTFVVLKCDTRAVSIVGQHHSIS